MALVCTPSGGNRGEKANGVFDFYCVGGAKHDRSTKAEAAFVDTFTEVGSNVVENGSGPINLNGLTLVAEVFIESPVIEPSRSYITSGSTLGLASIYEWVAGPTSFGSGGVTPASFSSGDISALIPVHFPICSGELFRRRRIGSTIDFFDLS
jgi:hypothetical protein